MLTILSLPCLPPVRMFTIRASRALLPLCFSVQWAIPSLIITANPPPLAVASGLLVFLSNLVTTYPSICGVGSPFLSLVSCRTTTSGFSSLTRPASSSTFVAIQSQFHCMILRPLLCLAPEVTSVSGWFPSWSAARSSLHSRHIHVPASLASSTASL